MVHQHTSECIAAMEAARLARELYMKDWPNYCRKCKGKGYSISKDGWLEDCGRCFFEDFCPRCGAEDEKMHTDLVCHLCGWEFDNNYGNSYLPFSGRCTCEAHANKDRIYLDTPIMRALSVSV